MATTPRLSPEVIRNLVTAALAEDVGSGDATTLAVVPEGVTVSAVLRNREDCVLAGLAVAEAVFRQLEPSLSLAGEFADGDACPAGSVVAEISGPARAILTGERTALNYLQRLSGIATLTRRYVDALGDGGPRLLDTRKTTPGWRALEKYAVAVGGGENHRFGLFDRILIKDNHLRLASLSGPGAIRRAVEACRAQYPKLLVEVEIDSLEQLPEALGCGVDFVLLDNLPNEDLSRAAAQRDQLAAGTLLEASGGITLERLPDLTWTGVDFVSVGAITHSARAVDIGLDIEPEAPYPG